MSERSSRLVRTSGFNDYAWKGGEATVANTKGEKDEKKGGILSRIFGKSSGGCCGVQIIPVDEAADAVKEANVDASAGDSAQQETKKN